MVKVKIQRSPKAGKDWQVKFKSPKTGRMRKISGGDGKKNEKGKSKLGAKSFKARHGKPTSAKQYVNKKLWENKKIGDTVNIPNKFL